MANRVGGRAPVAPEVQLVRSIEVAKADYDRATATAAPLALFSREYHLARALKRIAAGEVRARDTIRFASTALDDWEEQLPVLLRGAE